MMHRVLLLVTIASLFVSQICASSKLSAKNSAAQASPLSSHGLLKPKTKTNTHLAENDPNVTLISAKGKLASVSQCPLASVFGLKTTKTVRLVKDGEFSVCNNLSQTCCRADSLKNLNKRFNKHIESQRKMVWSYTRIGRLMLQVVKNLDSRATACIKGDKKLQKKLSPPRKLSVKKIATTHEQHAKRVAVNIVFPGTAGSSKAAKKSLNCTEDAKKLKKATKALREVHSEYESQIKTCRKVIDEVRSRLICASCDPNNNYAIHGFEKKVEVSEEDYNQINQACSRPYWIIWRRQRPWIKAAFNYVKHLTGRSMKKFAHAVSHIDRFNNEDCFKYGKIVKKGKADKKLLGIKLVQDFREAKSDDSKANKKQNRMLFSTGANVRENKEHSHYTHHCMRGIGFISRRVFDLRENRRISSKKYNVFKLIFNTLGNKKIRDSFKRIVPKSVMPLTKKQKAALRAKKAKASKAKKAAKKSSKTAKNKKVKVIKGKKSPAKALKKKGKTFKKVPIKQMKPRWNPITKDHLKKWELVHSDPVKKSKHENISINLKDYKDTGLKSLDVKKGKEQLVDPLTK